jgi:hypothetical protein
MCRFEGVELLDKLYERVGSKLDSDLNILSLIKHLRDVKIMSNQKLNAETKFKIDHSHKNLVNLDTSEDSFNSSVGSDFFKNADTLTHEDITIPKR